LYENNSSIHDANAVPGARSSFRVQQWVAAISLLLFAVKISAWFITHSVAILTDALESIANIIASFIGLYSLYVAAKPRDADHPYGHGKAEYISAAVEGALVTAAGLMIVYEAIRNLFYPHPLKQLDTGMILIGAAALANFLTGAWCIRKGKRNQSLALQASGKHLQSDTWTTAGIIAGLGLVMLTGISWLDSAVALLFAIITGFNILRSSAAGIMDKADDRLLREMIEKLEQNRRENWVDFHNLRILKYGSILHLDAHLTVPWYLNVHEAHNEVDALATLIRNYYGNSVELFVHTDGCLPFSCKICTRTNCNERKHAFEKRVQWTTENVLSNSKHQL
jgi:cation diffusion facilitator family transporter